MTTQTPMDEMIEHAIGGSYEMPDGRKFWIDGPVAREIARRVAVKIEAQNFDLTQALARKDSDLSAVREHYRDLEAQNFDLTQAIARKDAEIAELEADDAALRAWVKRNGERQDDHYRRGYEDAHRLAVEHFAGHDCEPDCEYKEEADEQIADITRDLSAARERIAELKREMSARPTTWAYEQVFDAFTQWQAKAERLTRELAEERAENAIYADENLWTRMPRTQNSCACGREFIGFVAYSSHVSPEGVRFTRRHTHGDSWCANKPLQSGDFDPLAALPPEATTPSASPSVQGMGEIDGAQWSEPPCGIPWEDHVREVIGPDHECVSPSDGETELDPICGKCGDPKRFHCHRNSGLGNSDCKLGQGCGLTHCPGLSPASTDTEVEP